MRQRFPLVMIIFLLIFMAGCAIGDSLIKTSPIITDTLTDYREAISEGGLVVHYIDVGQGDATLIQLFTGENILIDAGEVDKGLVVQEYLLAQGVEKIDYLIVTHPHSDHIGGLPVIIDNFAIGQIYMPKVVHNTTTYENLLLSIKNKGLKVTAAKAGIRLPTSEAFAISFLAPNADKYESLNNYSIVTKLEYQEHVFLFTGDAEPISGREIINNNYDIRAQVLDIAHHGSTNSLSSKEFLQRVNPDIAVISVGSDNSYNHPHAEILEILQEMGVNILRTDQDGNIIIVSDGEKFTINKNIVLNNDKTFTAKYIGNKNSKVFHLPTCGSLPSEKNRIYFTSRDEALANGYKPCGQCQP